MKTRYGKDYFARARVGLFSHYTYPTYAEDKGKNYDGTHYSAQDPRTAGSAEEAAASRDSGLTSTVLPQTSAIMSENAIRTR